MKSNTRGKGSLIQHKMTTFISSHLRNGRIEKGLSQTELAKQADISVSFLCELEHGNILPSIITYSVLCHILNIEPSLPLLDDSNE